eukprot:CAMPEP_0172733762 /NCGR_PEP_ID=MMETSP1074-20121228/108019_1 /TAXON_ID=2916 /ORGANISM="Ceratium fusus, Strain PA161109" /LENGTH=389 /DNA_ID=CAMNT_0013562387 /DNA_START=48 /DNA_END=1218 /DNA_ORIENTATION=-
MDEVRKLLDSLMGQSRDADLMEAKKNKGKNFTQDNVCKFYLLGFCPQWELANSKLTTKRNLGQCCKVHSEAMKQEFEEHPEKEKYQAEYERSFLPFLEGQVREADAWVTRERANAQKAEATAREKTTVQTMPANVKEQITQLEADMNKMMASAEELAENGDIEGSKFKVVLAEEIKNKVKEIETKHPSYTVTLKEEWVCEVCGTRTEAVTENNETRFAAHFQGKVHVGYAKIRDWVKELRKKQRDGDDGAASTVTGAGIVAFDAGAAHEAGTETVIAADAEAAAGKTATERSGDVARAAQENRPSLQVTVPLPQAAWRLVVAEATARRRNVVQGAVRGVVAVVIAIENGGAVRSTAVAVGLEVAVNAVVDTCDAAATFPPSVMQCLAAT